MISANSLNVMVRHIGKRHVISLKEGKTCIIIFETTSCNSGCLVLKKCEEDNVEVIIAGAGLAAHLPGVIASMTVLPVIGVPLEGNQKGFSY